MKCPSVTVSVRYGDHVVRLVDHEINFVFERHVPLSCMWPNRAIRRAIDLAERMWFEARTRVIEETSTEKEIKKLKEELAEVTVEIIQGRKNLLVIDQLVQDKTAEIKKHKAEIQRLLEENLNLHNGQASLRSRLDGRSQRIQDLQAKNEKLRLWLIGKGFSTKPDVHTAAQKAISDTQRFEQNERQVRQYYMDAVIDLKRIALKWTGINPEEDIDVAQLISRMKEIQEALKKV